MYTISMKDVYTHDHERALEQEVLAKYDLPHGLTIWRSHDTIGLDDEAHYFSHGTDKYVLVWSDHPNETFIHEEKLPPVYVRGGPDEWLHIESGELTGHYSLYHDVVLSNKPAVS